MPFTYNLATEKVQVSIEFVRGVERKARLPDTNWLLFDDVEILWAGIDVLAFDLVGPAAVVPDAAKGVRDVCHGHRQSFAVVKRFDCGDGLVVLFHEIGEVCEDPSPFAGGHPFPWTLESLAGGSDGDVDICEENRSEIAYTSRPLLTSPARFLPLLNPVS